MAQIVYIHQYFKTPEQPGGTRSYWFSKKLIESGHNVTMITSRPSQEKLIETVLIEKIKVIYIKNSYSNDMSVLRRLTSFTRFMIISTLVCLRQKRVDLIYATSTPLTVGFPVLIVNFVKGIPYVFEVRDLWPEVPIQMGGLKNSIFKMLAIKFEKLIYKKARHVIALSPGMVEGVIEKGSPMEKVSMIPNMSKIDKFYKREKNIKIAQRFKIDLNKFNVIHFGTMGIANGLEYIIEAAEILSKETNKTINFIFLGKGGVKSKLHRIVKERKIENVTFIDAQPMDTVSEIVNLCNLSIVSFKDIPILQTNSPNKLFDSLSAGIPIVVNSAGWTKSLVEESQCGAYVDPAKPEEFASLLLNWMTDTSKLKSMGDSARALAENVYDKTILVNQFIQVIEDNI